ncbi:MAG: hypothetical protein M3O34_14475 [Chloroflexota bacterium]|nr:hypothetical protein [Chloroflexota bacterium]
MVELRAEPWFMTGGAITEVPVRRHVETFPPAMLRDHLRYAKSTEFSAVCLWVV